MHTQFTQLYIAGNFPYLTEVVRISGREWVPIRPSHHLNLYPLNRLYTKLAKELQTVRIHLSNLTCSFCFPCKSFHMSCYYGQSKQSLAKCNASPIPECPALSCAPFEKSIQSSATDYFKSHLLAHHSMNEGESATNLRVIFNLKHYNIQMTHTKICTTCPSI